MSLKKTAVTGLFWAFLQQFSSQGVSFLVTIILARILLPEEFGLIAMLGVFIALASALINSGLTQSLIRSENIDDEDYSTVFYFNLLTSLIIYLTFCFSAPLISQFFKQEVLTLIIRVYCITFIINAISSIQIARLTKQLNFKTQMQVSLPSVIIGGITGIALAINGYGVWSLVWNGIVQSFISTLLFWYLSKWLPSWHFNVKKFKIHFNYGIKLMFSAIIDVLYSNIYVIIIGKYFSPAQVGFYNRADTLQMLPVGNISAIITKVTFPLFSNIQNDNEHLKNIYSRILKMVVFLVAPTLIIMASLAEPLFRFLFSDKWLEAVPYFQILCFSGILYPIHSYNLQILNVKGRSDLFLKLEIVKKIIFTSIIFISIPFGIKGLLFGGLISSLIGLFINTYYSGVFLNYTAIQQAKDLLPIILIAIVSGIPVYLLDQFIAFDIFSDFFRLFIGTIVGLSIFAVLSHLFKLNSLQELINLSKNK